MARVFAGAAVHDHGFNNANGLEPQSIAVMHSYLVACTAFASAAVHDRGFNNANGVKPQPLAGTHANMVRAAS